MSVRGNQDHNSYAPRIEQPDREIKDRVFNLNLTRDASDSHP